MDTCFKNRSLLFIIPHPDDEAFYFGGTISKYVKNSDVSLLLLTEGERGRVSIKSEDKIVMLKEAYNEDKELAKLRKNEFFEACALVGIGKDKIYSLKLPNTEINYNHLKSIEKVIKEIDSEVIVSFSEAGTSRPTNPDHSWSAILTYIGINNLIKEKSVKNFRRFFTYTSPHASKIFDQYSEINVSINYLTTINIETTLQTKKDMIDCHKSQIHLKEFFEKVGFSNINSEYYLERINMCLTSAQGTEDFFSETVTSKKDLIMPLQYNSYIFSNPEYKEMLISKMLSITNTV